jgi:chromosome segregation ATPase
MASKKTGYQQHVLLTRLRELQYRVSKQDAMLLSLSPEREMDARITEMDRAHVEVVSGKDAEIAQLRADLAGAKRVDAIAAWKREVVDAKDAEIAAKDAEIARLRAELLAAAAAPTANDGAAAAIAKTLRAQTKKELKALNAKAASLAEDLHLAESTLRAVGAARVVASPVIERAPPRARRLARENEALQRSNARLMLESVVGLFGGDDAV